MKAVMLPFIPPTIQLKNLSDFTDTQSLGTCISILHSAEEII